MKTVLKSLTSQLEKVKDELSKVRKDVHSQNLRVASLAVNKESRLCAAKKGLENAVFELEQLLQM